MWPYQKPSARNGFCVISLVSSESDSEDSTRGKEGSTIKSLVLPSLAGGGVLEEGAGSPPPPPLHAARAAIENRERIAFFMARTPVSVAVRSVRIDERDVLPFEASDLVFVVRGCNQTEVSRPDKQRPGGDE